MRDGVKRKKDKESFSGIEYLLFKLQTAMSCARNVQELWKKQNNSDESQSEMKLYAFFESFLLAAILQFLNECLTLANCLADAVVCGKAASHLADDCRDLTNHCIDLYTNFQTSASIQIYAIKMISFPECLVPTSIDADKQSNELIQRLNLLTEKTKISLQNSHS